MSQTLCDEPPQAATRGPPGIAFVGNEFKKKKAMHNANVSVTDSVALNVGLL